MNKNISFSSLKEKINSTVLLVVAMVVLVAVLGVATWFTVKNGLGKQEQINNLNSEYNIQKNLIGSYENIKNNTAAFQKEQEKINNKIASINDYDEREYFSELYYMCGDYNLKISDENGGIEVGSMVATGDGVYAAETRVAVVGDELNVRRMINDIISVENVTRVDDIAMVAQEDGTVVASFTIINIAK